MKIKTTIAAMAALGALGAALVACSSDADVASHNISRAADSFEVNRRITFYNGITGQNIMVIEGLCSLGNNDTRQRMSVTCKTGPNEYRRHFLGLSDNVTFFAEHLDPSSVSTARYRVFFRPSALIPDLEFQR